MKKGIFGTIGILILITQTYNWITIVRHHSFADQSNSFIAGTFIGSFVMLMLAYFLLRKAFKSEVVEAEM